MMEIVINGRQFFPVTATGGGCAGCAGENEHDVCMELSADDRCHGVIFRELTGKFHVPVPNNEPKLYEVSEYSSINRRSICV